MAHSKVLAIPYGLLFARLGYLLAAGAGTVLVRWAAAIATALTRATRVLSLPGQLRAFKAAMNGASCVCCLAQLGLWRKLSGCHMMCVSSTDTCMYDA